MRLVILIALALAGCSDPAVRERLLRDERAVCQAQQVGGTVLVKLVAVGTTMAAPEAAPLATLGAGATQVMLDAACARLGAEAVDKKKAPPVPPVGLSFGSGAF